MAPVLPAAPARPAPAIGRWVRIDVEHATTVEVDGATVADPDPHLPAQQAGTRLPVVTVRMPGYRAHSLSHLLTRWNELTTLMAAEHRATPDWSDLAHALHGPWPPPVSPRRPAAPNGGPMGKVGASSLE